MSSHIVSSFSMGGSLKVDEVADPLPLQGAAKDVHDNHARRLHTHLLEP